MSKDESKIIPFNRQNKRSVVMISATSKDNYIGSNNQIPWQCSEDMHFFKEATTGNVVVMGRKTFESLGSKPLPNRLNIVVSSTLKESAHENVIVVSDLLRAIAVAQDLDLSGFNRNTKHEHVFIIGGANIYRQSFKYIDESLISMIDVTINHGVEYPKTEHMQWFEKYDTAIVTNLYYNNTPIFTKKDRLTGILHTKSIKQTNAFAFKEKK